MQHPQVESCRVENVPELFHFQTDKPNPGGELLVKSRKFLRGYHMRPNATRSVTTHDGTYRTGNIFEELIKEDVHMRLIDRSDNVLNCCKASYNAVAV